MVRIKERYLLVNILYPHDASRTAKNNVPNFVVQHQPTVEKLTAQALLKAIRKEVASLYGDYGAGALGSHLSVKYLSLATSTFILRCSRDHYQLLWSVLTFMNNVPVPDGRPCVFRVVRVSGTIRKAEEEAIRQAKHLVLAAREQQRSSLTPSIFASMRQESDTAMIEVSDNHSDVSMHDEDG